MRPVVLALAAVQVVLPASLLVARWSQEGLRPVTEYPASWQMYSARPLPDYTGTDAAGRERRVEVDDLPALLRDVGTGRVVPDRLCRHFPDLVRVQRAGGPDPGTYRC